MAGRSRTDRFLRSIGLNESAIRLVKRESKKTGKSALKVVAEVSLAVRQVADSAKRITRAAELPFRKYFVGRLNEVKDSDFVKNLNEAIKKAFGDGKNGEDR